MFQQGNTSQQSRTVTCQLAMKIEKKKKEKREKEAKKKKEMKVRKIEVTPSKLRCITSPVSNTSAVFLGKNKQQG